MHNTISFLTFYFTDDYLHRVAVKGLKHNSDSKDYNDLVAELKLMQQVGKHPNVVELVGTCSVNGPLYVVMEIMNGGNLLDFLRKSRISDDSAASMSSVLSTRQIVQIASDVAQGMHHISGKGMVHRDLAARNILLNENNVAKVWVKPVLLSLMRFHLQIFGYLESVLS